MSDVLVVCIITAIVFIIFAAVRLFHVEKGRRDIVSESWRREQVKKDRDTYDSVMREGRRRGKRLDADKDEEIDAKSWTNRWRDE